MNVKPRAVPMLGKKLPEFLPSEDTALFSSLLYLADNSGRIAVDLFSVQCLSEDHLHDTKRLVDSRQCVLRQKPRTKIEHICTGNLGQPFFCEGVAKDVLLEPLALYLGVPPGNTHSLLAQPSDVRITVPIEERLCIPAET